MEDSTRIFFDNEVQRIIEDFSYCFGVKVTLYSPMVEEWLVGVFLKSSDYCTLIQRQLHLRPRCLTQDKTMCLRCRRLGKMTVYRCHGGMNEAVMPLDLEDRHLGFAMVGQFRTTDHVSPPVMHLWQEQGLDQRLLTDAFMARPYFDSERLERMLHLFSRLMTLITASSYVKVWQPQLVEQVIQYLNAHMEEPSDLEAVSEAIGRSSSTISHAIKQKCGVSFKNLATIHKIQRFESILDKNPSLRINEACRQVGFTDQLYFSRIYRKYRGCTPTEYRKTLAIPKETEEMQI